jgi:hypothetical protein
MTYRLFARRVHQNHHLMATTGTGQNRTRDRSCPRIEPTPWSRRDDLSSTYALMVIVTQPVAEPYSFVTVTGNLSVL